MFIFFLLSKRYDAVIVCCKKLINQPYNYLVLLSLLVLGFFAKLDYTDMWGCFRANEPIFAIKNIIFSSISLLLIFLSFIIKKRTLKLSFAAIELLFWIFKLFYYKGGYVVGIGASPHPVISFYDTTTLTFRLLIISNLSKKEIRIRYILLTTTLVMAIKIFICPTHYFIYVEEKRSLERSVYTKNKLAGKWIGVNEYSFVEDDSAKYFVDTTQVNINDDLIIIYNFNNLDSIRLRIEFESEYSGHLCEMTENNQTNKDCNFYIPAITEDSLYFLLNYELKNYSFKLKREGN